MPLYEIVLYSFCTVLKYVVLEGKLCPPQCDRYGFNIQYCCPLTEAESVTKDCASRGNDLQSGQATLQKHVSIHQHILPLLYMVCKWFLRIFKWVYDTHIFIHVLILFLFLFILNNTFLLDITAMWTFSRIFCVHCSNMFC